MNIRAYKLIPKTDTEANREFVKLVAAKLVWLNIIESSCCDKSLKSITSCSIILSSSTTVAKCCKSSFVSLLNTLVSIFWVSSSTIFTVSM